VFGLAETAAGRRYYERLERELRRELHLQRIADARSQEAIEVEQRGRDERIDVVVIVERVEHLEDRRDRVPTIAPAERTGQSPIQGEELIVLPDAIAASVHAVEDAGIRSDRLRRPRLNAYVAFKSARQF